MEQQLCWKTSLTALINSPGPIKDLYFKGSYVVAPKVYVDSPICHNHSFVPSLNDAVFSVWYQKGICNMRNLYIDGNRASFSQLSAKYNIPASNFFRYLQIRDYLRKHLPNFQNLYKHETLEAINRFDPHKSGAISHFYHILLNQNAIGTSAIKQAWSDEFRVEIAEDTWSDCLRNVHKCSVNLKHNLIQFKTLHRIYYSRVKLQHFFADVSPLCNRCKSADGTLAHTFWLCSHLFSYWENIFSCFSVAFGKCWKPDPLVAILGAASLLTSASKYEKRAILFGMVVAKKLILQVWKKDHVPSYDLWMGEMANSGETETL